MERTATKLLKEYVNEKKFISTGDIMEAMKNMFADVLNQVLEVELEQKLGYKKSETMSLDDKVRVSKNY